MIQILRRFLNVLILLTCLATIAFASFYYLTRTEAGLRTSWAVAQRFIPGNIHIDQLNGSVHETMTVKGFHYHINGTTITIDQGDIDANVWALLTKQIIVQHVNASHVSIDLPPPAADDSSSTFGMNDLIDLLSSIHIHQAAVADLRVTRSGHILFQTDAITIQQHENNTSLLNVSLPNGHLNIAVRQTPWTAQWQLDIPDIRQLLPAMSGSLTSNGVLNYHQGSPVITGTLNANHIGTPDYSIGHIEGTVGNRINDSRYFDASLQLHAIQLQTIKIPNTSVVINSQIQDDRISAESSITIDSKTSAVAEMAFIRNASSANAPITLTGSITAHANDLSSLKSYLVQVPQLKSMTGELNAALKITGTLHEPLISLQASLDNGSLNIPEYKTQLTNLRLQASYLPNQAINLNGSVNLGQGKADITGDIKIANNDIIVNAAVKGSNLQIANTTEYNVLADPDLQFHYAKHQLDISGSISIPSAIIKPTDFRSTVTLPNDVVIVNQPSSTSLPLNIGLSVQLSLGDRIKINYQNLSAKITGSLHITQKPGNSPRAIGELTTSDGTYKGYGKNLTIETGRLIYTGNLLSNPGIDVRAIQRIRSVTTSGQTQFGSSSFQPTYTGTDMITVGIWIRGTLNKPVLTLFSEPAGLSQGDILSYLLLGYPQSQASGASSLALLNMASSGQGGAANVTNKVQNVFGLTELGVGSTEYFDTTSNTTQSATTVNVGRNLGHNLSLHYNIGLFTSVSIFSLRYQISKHFALQSETSSLENGGDLLYQIEGGD